MAQASIPDLATIMLRQQRTCANGDVAVVGSFITVVSEHLYEVVAPTVTHRGRRVQKP